MNRKKKYFLCKIIDNLIFNQSNMIYIIHVMKKGLYIRFIFFIKTSFIYACSLLSVKLK